MPLASKKCSSDTLAYDGAQHLSRPVGDDDGAQHLRRPVEDDEGAKKPRKPNRCKKYLGNKSIHHRTETRTDSMPAHLSESPRKGRTKANRFISPTPLANSRSNRTTKKEGMRYDARANAKKSLCEKRLAKYGVAKGKLPSTLDELLSLSNSSTLEDMDDGFGDGLGGFGECDMPDYNHECELELDSTDSEEEPEDDEAQDLRPQDDQNQYSTEPSDNLKRNRKEVDSWTQLIAVVTANVQTPTSSRSCSCRKSRKTLPTVSFNCLQVFLNILICC